MRMIAMAWLFARWFKRWLWLLKDALPPYREVEGPLETKETNLGGNCYVFVSSIWIEVDRSTFETLVVGENLHVRYTRGKRAVNIDRLLPGKGPG